MKIFLTFKYEVDINATKILRNNHDFGLAIPVALRLEREERERERKVGSI